MNRQWYIKEGILFAEFNRPEGDFVLRDEQNEHSFNFYANEIDTIMNTLQCIKNYYEYKELAEKERMLLVKWK